MLSEEEIKNVASLARLKLTGEETERFRGELTVILDFVEQLKELSIEGVQPLTQVGGLVNVAREDSAERANSPLSEKMLEQAPERKDDFVKVKAILK